MKFYAKSGLGAPCSSVVAKAHGPRVAELFVCRFFKKFLFLSLLFIAVGVQADSFTHRLVEAAKERTTHQVTYDGGYRSIDYPNGDVPDNVGVCTDLVIRAFRGAGVDLQRAVHEDMKAHFDRYPSRRIWGLKGTDRNIDHRRVPNLQVWLSRFGERLKVTHNGDDYQPGDLVTWMLPGNLPHIGIVVDRRSADGERPLIVHNIGRGPRMEDRLFDYPITGHYRYNP